MYYKIYNPDPKDFITNVLDTYITIPALGFVVVSELVGITLQTNYAQLEVTEATLEQYQDYRASKDAEEQQAEPAEPAPAVDNPAAISPDIAQPTPPDEHQAIVDAQAADAAAQQQADAQAAADQEQATIAQLGATTVRQVSPGNCPDSHNPPKVKKAKTNSI